MTIGIISINAHTKVLNFASVLHSYAFQHFLSEHGIESTILDYKPIYYKDYDARHPLFSCIDHPHRDPEQQARELKKWRSLFYERETRYDKLEAFYKQYYNMTDTCYTAQSLETLDPGFDCYLCVTDVIWKWNQGHGFDHGFFLACKAMEGKKKIAYAASRGGSKYSAEQEAEFLPMVADFDMISVREHKLQGYLSKLMGQEIPQVVDPVFLNDRVFYEGLEREPENAPKGDYVLIYVVMDETPWLRERALRFAREQGLEIIELSDFTEDAQVPEGVRYRTVYDIGVEEWLWYMHHAAYIFTNSFHCCCFSAIYGRNFFAGPRGGDKIPTVLNILGLEDRRVLNDEDLKNALAHPVNPETISERIAVCRKASGDWILSAIHEVEEREHRPMLQPEQVEAILRERKTVFTKDKAVSKYGKYIKNPRLRRGIKKLFRIS